MLLVWHRPSLLVSYMLKMVLPIHMHVAQRGVYVILPLSRHQLGHNLFLYGCSLILCRHVDVVILLSDTPENYRCLWMMTAAIGQQKYEIMKVQSKDMYDVKMMSRHRLGPNLFLSGCSLILCLPVDVVILLSDAPENYRCLWLLNAAIGQHKYESMKVQCKDMYGWLWMRLLIDLEG